MKYPFDLYSGLMVALIWVLWDPRLIAAPYEDSLSPTKRFR